MSQTTSKELLSKALMQIRRLKAENAELQAGANEPIAVVGMACRFPGESNDPEEYWDFLREGKSAIRPTPANRGEGVSGSFGSYLEDVDLFDAAFFGISPKEAQSLDPQQRLLLEMSWHALESANIRPETIAGKEVGVFVGMSGIDYALKLFSPGNRSLIDPYFGTGTTLSPAAGRLSYFLKVNGPSMVVDTACSSSLVAIHLACESLRKGECEAAFVAGVNRILGADLTRNFAESGLLSKDGICYTFDERAQGYSRGEGGGMLLLKKLSDAEAAGDRVMALILGSAVNQDGGSGGLTVPSGPAQQRVIRRALRAAGVSSAEVGYVETHGTATPLGDPIEANALGEVFQEGRDGRNPLRIGSVKTNFGHLEAAAGMASSFKVIQALRKEGIPPHLHFSRPNGHVDWESFSLRVVTEQEPWVRSENRRVAGVSGFGFAGTNAHVVFAEAPKMEPVAEEAKGDESAEILTLSARTPEALRELAGAYGELLKNEKTGWRSVAQTARNSRASFGERLSLVATSGSEAAGLLSRYVEKGKARGVGTGTAREGLRVAFVFTGQGAQYTGMGRQLYEREPRFREIVDECAEKLRPLIGRDIREVLFAETEVSGGEEGAGSVLDHARNRAELAEVDQTLFTQTGLFVVEYALAKLWESWGVRPDVVLGHSVGEYAAACVAGVMDLDAALQLIAARGKLMEEKSGAGAMLTVFADEKIVEERLRPFVDQAAIAAVNGPEIVLVSGAVAAIDALEKQFAEDGLRTVRMRISHAFHSPMTEPILGDLRKVGSGLRMNRPEIPLISNVTGAFVSEEIARPEYWVRHIRQSVQFCESMKLLHAQKLDLLIEIGPEPTLSGLDMCFREVRAETDSTAKWLPSLRRGQEDLRSMLDSVGRVWAAGGAVDWKAIRKDGEFEKVSLPLYPYQRKRHWLEDLEAPVREVETREPEKEMEKRMKVDVLSAVQEIISEVSGFEAADLHLEANLMEMGLDSLMFVRMGRVLEKRFEVRISIRQFYEDLHRIGPLVQFLEENGKLIVEPEPAVPAIPVAAARVAEVPEAASERTVPAIPAADGLDPVWAAHFRLMEQYIGISGGNGRTIPQAREEMQPTVRSTVVVPARVDSRMTANFAGMNLEEEKGLSAEQREFLQQLGERFIARTGRSKAQTQAVRKDLADWKHSLQFKRTLKELKYPIISDRSMGSRIWDVDGNEYIDLALGMGVHFLGHGPDFLREALHRQIDRTVALGPQSDLAGEVARKICQLTGAERASLAITGSGAVMLAQRLARAETGRPLIAQFAGSYHGIGSEVLAVAGEEGTLPLSPGIPVGAVESARILDYGSDEALEWIRENAEHLAAVIVEPVQSRKPGFQPHRFLRRLRKLTQELDIALIFDEMITGFRIHPGGAQAWFGIEADLVTYGKIVGGGLPLSAVAGKARYLDWIDGGFWQYGDDSTPNGKTIFTGGTHNRHPLALAAANATLDYLISEGPELQAVVTRRTARLVQELNAFLERENVAFRLAHFGSQFRFENLGDAFDLEVFFYLLTCKGIYTWEQRICCLSIAHTEEEIDQIIEAVKEAVREMRAGGFAVLAGPAAPRKVMPLSAVQRRLYALCQRDGAEMPYHLSGVWRLEGPVDFFRLQDAFQEVVRRHESLRTAFCLIDGEPCQYLMEEPRFSVAVLPKEGKSAEVILDGFIKPFDLEEPPLMRVGYSEDGFLLIDVHHIAADGLSMNVILREFAALYDGQTLPIVKRQYRHAILEAEQLRESPEGKEGERYWLEEMRGELPVLALPTDFPRSGEMDFAGDKCLVSISSEKTRRLEQFARAQDSSLYMVLIGVFATLLHRLTETEDLIVGLPVAGRPGMESDDVVGMFVNSLPLRFRPEAGVSFGEFLKKVRRTCLDAYDHSDYGFGDLIERLELPISPDRNPLFDVMFAYENADDRVMGTADLKIETIDQFEGSGMFDFNVDIIREAGVLNIRFHYATRLFRRETIEGWSRLFAALIDAVIENPERPLGLLEMWKPEALREKMEVFNAASGKAREGETLVSLWNEAVRKHGESVALVWGERQLTFAQADELAGKLTLYLKDTHGVGVEDRVAISVDSTERMILAILGVLKSGAAYVPVDPANPAERVQFILEDCGAKLLLTEDWPEKLIGDGFAAQEKAAVKASDLAYVLYTSGTTGRPKGVLIEHGSIANSILWRIGAYGISAKDVTLQMPSFAFDASLLDIFPVLFAGGRLVMVPSREKQDLAAQASVIRREAVTNLLLTSSLYALYLQEMGTALGSLRFVTVAGETVSIGLVGKHFETLPTVRLFNEYGPTENSVVTSCTELFAEDESVSIGRPVAGSQVFILERNGWPVGPGVSGELAVSGIGLARGYLNLPELTAASFVEAVWEAGLRIYRTGDLARWREDGTIEYLGRRDGQVKLRGYRIELDEIENRLREQPGVDEAAVKVAEVAGSLQVIGYIVSKNGFDENGVRAGLRKVLPDYMVPSVFVELGKLPLNTSGKVDRKSLPIPEQTKAEGKKEAPIGEAEEVLASVWAEVLRREVADRREDYFRLGGDSIKGIQIVSRLAKRGWRLEMRLLFRHPTMAELAPHLEKKQVSSGVVRMKQLEGDVPLGAIQSWFFRMGMGNLNHFNQGVWLGAGAGGFREQWLEKALEAVIRRHDVFRLRFPRSSEGRGQRYVGISGASDFSTVDLRGENGAAARMDAEVRRAQASLDIERGPLSRMVWFRLEGGDRIFWTIHHLVVDGVSWRNLLQDLASGYAALERGEEVVFPELEVSFGDWTRSVRETANSGVFAGQAEFWEAVVAGGAPRLPEKDLGKKGTAESLAMISAELEGETVAELLGDGHRVFRTRGVELFLTAFRRAYREWNPGEDFYVLLEGHGRESVLSELDVAGNVGWFTSQYPVRFGAEEGDEPRVTKEVLRQIPDNGVGFGLLSELGGEAQLAEAVLPEISFNYLGELDSGGTENPFVLLPERPGFSQDLKRELAQAIQVFGYARNGVLHWFVEYDSGRLEEAKVKELLAGFVENLEKLAGELALAEGSFPSPADFACQGLTLAAFDKLLGRYSWRADEIADIFPLSPMQKGLYYEALKAPRSDAYFEQMAFRLEGALDLVAFEAAWRELVARHAVLRSVFVEGDYPEPLQVVLEEMELPFGCESLASASGARIETFKVEDRSDGFELDRGPLMRVRVFQLDGRNFQVVWSHHHILMDGWCVGILYEELMRIYEGLLGEPGLKLEAPADYREYLKWMQRYETKTALAFWKNELSGVEMLTGLPRVGGGDLAAALYQKSRFRVDGAGWGRLQDIARESGATTATLLQALWGILLARYNGTRDVVFGGIVSGRPEEVDGVERMVGLFINAIPVRLRFAEEATLTEVLREFQREALERRPFEYVALADVQQQSEGLRELFDHLVVLENYPMEEELRGEGSGSLGEEIRPRIYQIEGFERTHFDFTLVAVPEAEGLMLELTHNEAVYGANQIARVQEHFLQLVESLARAPEMCCLAADLLPAEELDLLESWNATGADYPKEATIISLFEEQVGRHSERVAVSFEGRDRTYAEINAEAEKLAEKLKKIGMVAGERVAVRLPRGSEIVVTFLGILKAGGAYVPVDSAYPEERQEFILEDSGAGFVISEEGVQVLETRTAGRGAEELGPDSCAYIIYTSGSTGKPKGCQVSHRNVVRLMTNSRVDFSFSEEDVWVVAHSFGFDFSVWEMYGALLYGGRVVVLPTDEVRDTRSFVDWVIRERVTVLNQTPAAFYAFIEEALKRDHDFGEHLRYVVFGGDRLEPHYLLPWVERFGVESPQLINMYGITETTVHVTYHRLTEPEIRETDGRSWIGRPLPETEVWVMDEALRPLPIGVAGEMYVGGSGVSLGYLNRPELTAERFLTDPRRPGELLYKTGDVGRWRDDGCLEYLGRNDDQVQVRGFRVEVGEVEAACLSLKGIRQAVVLPFERNPGQVELAAWLVGDKYSVAEMREALEVRLPNYMVPAVFAWVEEIPLTANGKFDRKALPLPGNENSAAREVVAPRNETESVLLGIWQTVLAVEMIGVHDNFFDLGGQSLKAVRLRSMIEDALGVTVSLRDLFAYATIAELGERLRPVSEEKTPEVDSELMDLMNQLSPEELEAHLKALED